jgi:hypothetical protein
MKSALARPIILLLALGSALWPAIAPAADKAVEIGGGKAVIFSVPTGWEIAPAEAPQDTASLGKTIKLDPKNGANAECNLTIFVPQDNRFADHGALKQVLVTSDESLVEDSLEGKVDAREFKTPHGFGYSAIFTDKKLVGKPSERGNYKVAATVVLYLPEQIVVTAAILCDDINGPEYAAMIALLRSLGAHSTSVGI